MLVGVEVCCRGSGGLLSKLGSVRAGQNPESEQEEGDSGAVPGVLAALALTVVHGNLITSMLRQPSMRILQGRASFMFGFGAW